MDGMYYSKYRTGKLTEQADVCVFLRHRQFAIDDQYANPMTIRLLLTYEALAAIQEEVKKYAEFIAEAKAVRGNPPPVYDPSRLMVSGVPNFVAPQGSRIPEYPMIHIYTALNSFYSNGGACLDRLGLELNKLYQLGVTKPDFGKLYGPKGPKKSSSVLKILQTPDAQTAHVFMQYRNRQMHDGLIRVDFGGGKLHFPVLLADGTSSNTYQEPDQLCTTQFETIENLIDTAYEVIWADLLN